MSQSRFFRHCVMLAALGAFSVAGCFVVGGDDDGGDDGGDEEGGSGNARGGRPSRGGSGGSNATGGSETGGSDSGGSSTGGSDSGGSSTGGRGGSSTGGGPPAGGSSTGGSSTGGSSTGGAPPTGGSSGSGPGEGAVLKFCNLLWLTDPVTMEQTAVDLTLDFAGVRVSALSDTCNPVVPETCIPIPAVSNPMVAVLDGTEVVMSGIFNGLVVVDGDELMLAAEFDMMVMMPALNAYDFPVGATCAETDPLTPVMATRSARIERTPFLDAFRDVGGRAAPTARGLGSKRYLPRK